MAKLHFVGASTDWKADFHERLYDREADLEGIHKLLFFRNCNYRCGGFRQGAFQFIFCAQTS